MASLRLDPAPDNVVMLADARAERTSFQTFHSISAPQSDHPSAAPTVFSFPQVSPDHPDASQSTPKTPKTRLPHDEQRTLAELSYLVPSLTDRELKARFPKAWTEHQTIRTKTSRKSSRDTLHPGFASFRDFLLSMGPAPSPAHSLDRLDPANPVYGPGMCRWATPKAQARNRSTNVHLAWSGERLTCAEWAERTGLNYRTLLSRVRAGWAPDRIFADAPAKRYRAGPASSSAHLAPDADAPVRKLLNDTETGHQHDSAAAIKAGRAPISQAHFAAWVTGSIVQELAKRLTAAGLWRLLDARTITTGCTERADLEKLAAGQGIDMAVFRAVRDAHDQFATTYLNEVTARAERDLFANPMLNRQGAAQSLRHLIKSNPQLNPHDVWKRHES